MVVVGCVRSRDGAPVITAADPPTLQHATNKDLCKLHRLAAVQQDRRSGGTAMLLALSICSLLASAMRELLVDAERVDVRARAVFHRRSLLVRRCSRPMRTSMRESDSSRRRSRAAMRASSSLTQNAQAARSARYGWRLAARGQYGRCESDSSRRRQCELPTGRVDGAISSIRVSTRCSRPNTDVDASLIARVGGNASFLLVNTERVDGAISLSTRCECERTPLGTRVPTR